MFNFKLYAFTVLSGLFFISGFCSAQELKDASTGKTFPRQVSVSQDGKESKLSVTGVSTRRKLIVKVYSVAHYMEFDSKIKVGDVFENILNSKSPKQLTIKWVRDIDQKRVQEAYHDSFNKVASDAEKASLKADIDKFIGFFGAVKAGDTHDIRWFSDGSVTVLYNWGEKGQIKNPAFARTLWTIWFGKDSVVNRNQLVSEIK